MKTPDVPPNNAADSIEDDEVKFPRKSGQGAETLGLASFTMQTGAGNRDAVATAVLAVARVIADAVPSRVAQ